MKLTADFGRRIRIDQHAYESIGQTDHLIVGQGFVRHLVTIVAPLGRKKQQQRLVLPASFAVTPLVAFDES